MKQAVTLAIDTAGPRLQLALHSSDISDSLVEEIATGHAEILFERVQQLLDRHQLSYEDLTRLAVTTGPGSFTGLRIGLSAARGLALALKLPLIGVPTLFAMSLSQSQAAAFSIVCDARRGEAYVQKFAQPGAPLAPATLMPLEAANDMPEAEKITPDRVDIAVLAEFAATADPAGFLPNPFYIRDADAKPQLKGKIAHALEPKP